MKFVPTKLYYKIREVSEIVGVEAHVLRFWETEFSALNPPKNRNGQRTYRPKDIVLILEIRKLLYEDGYTIAGARKRMGMQAPAPAPKKNAAKKKPTVYAGAAKPVKPTGWKSAQSIDAASGVSAEAETNDGCRDFGNDFVDDFNDDFSDDLGENGAVDRREFVELREPPKPDFLRHLRDSTAPAKPARARRQAGDGKLPTSERLKRVQSELENILTLLDRE